MERARPSRALLLGGLALLGVGCLPLIELLLTLRQTPSPDKMRVLLSLTALDKSTLFVSGLFASIGASLLALHLVDTPVLIAQKAGKLLFCLLLAAIVLNATILTAIAAHRGPDTPWRAEIYADHEGKFEQQVNDVFCHAKGLQVCQLGSVAEARQVFPLENWPVDSDRAPGRKIGTSCEGFKDSVQLWDYQSKMELCKLCGNVTREEQELQVQLGATHIAEVLAAVEQLSFRELQWCGEYLARREIDHDVGHSPYWKHRREFQTVLQYDTPPCSLFVAVRAMQLLEVVAAVCALAVMRWVWALRIKMVHTQKGKVDVV